MPQDNCTIFSISVHKQEDLSPIDKITGMYVMVPTQNESCSKYKSQTPGTEAIIFGKPIFVDALQTILIVIEPVVQGQFTIQFGKSELTAGSYINIGQARNEDFQQIFFKRSKFDSSGSDLYNSCIFDLFASTKT